MFNAERIINGTYGELWLEGEYVTECSGLQAVVEFEKEDMPIAGKLGTDTKFMGYKGTGSITLHKATSRMNRLLSDKIKRGINPRFQILSAIADPAAYGAERIMIKDASFDDLTLANWATGEPGEVECPFTYTDWEDLDLI